MTDGIPGDGSPQTNGVTDYKSRLIALLEGLEVVKPIEAAELSELHLKIIGEQIAEAAKINTRWW